MNINTLKYKFWLEASCKCAWLLFVCFSFRKQQINILMKIQSKLLTRGKCMFCKVIINEPVLFITLYTFVMWCRGIVAKHAVVSSIPPCVTFETPLARKATGNQLIKFTSVYSSEPVSGFYYARNRVCNAVVPLLYSYCSFFLTVLMSFSYLFAFSFFSHLFALSFSFIFTTLNVFFHL